jgi:hypothetical protein
VYDSFQNSPGVLVAVRLWQGGSGVYSDPIAVGLVDLNVDSYTPRSGDGTFAPYGQNPPGGAANGDRWIEVNANGDPVYGWFWTWKASLNRWLSPVQMLQFGGLRCDRSLALDAYKVLARRPAYIPTLGIYLNRFTVGVLPEYFGDPAQIYWTVELQRRSSNNSATTISSVSTQGTPDLNWVFYGVDVNSLLTLPNNFRMLTVNLNPSQAFPTDVGTLNLNAAIEFRYARAGA